MGGWETLFLNRHSLLVEWFTVTLLLGSSCAGTLEAFWPHRGGPVPKVFSAEFHEWGGPASANSAPRVEIQGGQVVSSAGRGRVVVVLLVAFLMAAPSNPLCPSNVGPCL